MFVMKMENQFQQNNTICIKMLTGRFWSWSRKSTKATISTSIPMERIKTRIILLITQNGAKIDSI